MIAKNNNTDTASCTSTSASSTMSTLTDRLRLLATRRDEMWWEIGVLLDEIATRGIVPHSFSSFAEFAESTIGLPADSATLFRRVSHHFSRESAIRFGANRLSLLLDYLEASPIAHNAIDILRVEVFVEDVDGLATVPFVDMSEADLAEAVWATRQREASSVPAIPAAAAVARDRLANTLAADAPNVRVKVHHEIADGTDEFSLSIVGIDPFNASTIATVLAEQSKTMTDDTE